MRTFFGIVGDISVLFTIDAILALFFGWLFMLAVGVVHHEWWSLVPTIGYWWSVLLVGLLRSAFYHVDWNGKD